ncbi:MAG: hypothetical protein PHO37_07515 [Kiritimatiellae bacterium]|nr:hypothetical protein [Kiritimatiellia bacterium]
MKKRFVILALMLPGCWLGAAPEKGEVPGSRVLAQPMYSGDGAVIVLSSSVKAAYRGPVLLFVNRTRELFLQGLNITPGSLNCPLEIRIGDKSDGDASVLSGRVRDTKGNLRERIELPDPEAADLTRFRRAIVVAFLRVYMVDAGGTDETMQDLPNWLIDGAIRYLDGSQRQADLDRAYLLWSRACLPPAEELYAFDSYAAQAEPALAATLSGWFLENRGTLFKRLLKEAANNNRWSPAYVARLLANSSVERFDGIMDQRWQALGHRVATPGVTTAGIMRRFRSELLLFPCDYGMMFNPERAYYTFQDALADPEDEDLRRAALDSAARIRMAAVGRDGMLLAVSEAYVTFLHAFAKGAKPSELGKMLHQAEGLRRELELRLEGGTVLMRDFEQ